MGLSSATAVLVGRSYGAGDGRGVLRAGLVGLGVVTALTLVVALLVWPSAHLIVGAYNRDPTLLAIAAPALVLATLPASVVVGRLLDVLEEQPTSARGHHCGRGACKTQPAAVNAFKRLPQGLLADYLRGLAWLHRRQHD